MQPIYYMKHLCHNIWNFVILMEKVNNFKFLLGYFQPILHQCSVFIPYGFLMISSGVQKKNIDLKYFQSHLNNVLQLLAFLTCFQHLKKWIESYSNQPCQFWVIKKVNQIAYQHFDNYIKELISRSCQSDSIVIQGKMKVLPPIMMKSNHCFYFVLFQIQAF